MQAATHAYQPDDPVTVLPLVGPTYTGKLALLNIATITDLLFHFPFRYEDTRNILSIAELKQQKSGTVQGTIISVGNTRTRNGKFLTRAVIEDATDSIVVVWFNQPYLSKTIRRGEQFLFSEKTDDKWGPISLISPQFERVTMDVFNWNENAETTHLGKLTPIYPETRGVSSKWLRARIKLLKPMITDLIQDPIPETVRQKEGLINLAQAVEIMHFPQDPDDIESARERLGIDELIRIRIQAQKMIKSRTEKDSFVIKHPSNAPSHAQLLAHLPFSLTNSQKTALEEILADLEKPVPMYRLLNGEVGSGKTVLALLAGLSVVDRGYSTVIMAPTTILAQQHYETITKLQRAAGLHIPIQRITTGKKQSPVADPHIIVGTHALLYRNLLQFSPGLIVIDEQHRFGVIQRKKLMEITSKGNALPHYLTMTATPIPRTLTMALYGSTSVSILNELPPGRIPVKTHVVSSRKRADSYAWIDEEAQKGHQIFIICPLVEGSEKVQATAVTQEYERLTRDIFPHRSLGLLHGQMSEADKNKALTDFRDHSFDILVATPVVEVGIDIPNATVMIIEDAERFGLAQLHQLRGRIGRGDQQSHCLLFTHMSSPEIRDRLEYFSTHPSGFDVAEYDLKRRGPGEVYGIRQSGLLNLRFADISDPNQFKRAERIADMMGNSILR